MAAEPEAHGGSGRIQLVGANRHFIKAAYLEASVMESPVGSLDEAEDVVIAFTHVHEGDNGEWLRCSRGLSNYSIGQT